MENVIICVLAIGAVLGFFIGRRAGVTTGKGQGAATTLIELQMMAPSNRDMLLGFAKKASEATSNDELLNLRIKLEDRAPPLLDSFRPMLKTADADEPAYLFPKYRDIVLHEIIGRRFGSI